jgi:hypothetical protein
MIALKTERLIHVLQQPSGGCNEDVHSRQAVLLVLQVLSSYDQTRRELMLVSDLAKNLEDLNRLKTRKTGQLFRRGRGGKQDAPIHE